MLIVLWLHLAAVSAIVPDELLGPEGVAIGAITLVIILGRLHLQSDARTTAERDEWKRLYLGTRGEFHKLAAVDERDLGIEAPKPAGSESP